MLTAGIALAVVAAGGGVRGAQLPVAGMVVSIEWLAARVADPAVVVISSDTREAYGRGHVPGARVLEHELTLGGDHRLLPPAALAAAFERAGARDDARIVLYGANAMATGWLYMALASIGHGDRVSMLDGNLDAWRRASRPVETAEPAPAPGRLTVRPAADVIVEAAWVRERLQSPATRVLDVRTPPERSRGYIPGSTLVLWQDLFSDQKLLTFKPREEIRTILTRAGLGDAHQAITYCAVGMRASLMYFAARYAGFTARVYVGSWEDWTRQNGFPIAR
jgi:thiosulfate/3-mercaptopyruvate sulfurtransferase